MNTIRKKKMNGGLKKRGVLALSVLLIAALVIPQAALATSEDEGVGESVPVSEAGENAQPEDSLGDIGGGGQR